MANIIRQPMPRRTFLKGMGTMVALPYLDAMTPANVLGRLGHAANPTRLLALEMVHGAAGCAPFGLTENLWAPPTTGRAFDLSKTSLSPLESWRQYLTIISNTDVRMAEAYKPEEIGGDHFRSSAVFLTQSHPTQTEGSDIFAGTSLDQLYAKRFGQATPIPSMQLCIEPLDRAGGCAYGYSCMYTDSISWSSPTDPLPMIRDPRVAFEQLFGAGGTPEERAARNKSTGSILDWITGRVAQLNRELGAGDRRRMEQYLDHIREIERRIQQVEARNTSGEERELAGAPAGVPDNFGDHVKIMFDLQVLALQSDMTRVFSFKMGRDASARVYPDSGVMTGFHPASHHGNNPARVKEFAEINKYHVSLLPYLLDKLKTTMDGDTPLLDRTTIIYGSPMSDSNTHNHRRCPLIVLGGGHGKDAGNQHLRAPDGTPMANAMLSLLHKIGMDDLNTFGDSNGEFTF
ncbi:DUF1552 domain-containing protein [Gemmatimonas phototrophica]|uniref:DUF1552 domain-containing protein n=1 Tax=Gemmatimonas phototrophica TaxID=1379270 RepID=A0A143BI91_9BACT|nr:DUF1552 domain-containing protein [Gemmatimonas phototrophica]AMW04262.1 hypothetical protein GEMMAAP_04235 [Gemmatimonas phototrophica]